ncbi:MAG: cytochrome b/b6 domain-containing protein [Pseudomonadota bacterium]
MNDKPTTDPKRSVTSSYSAIAQYLHWAVAAMIALQYILMEFAESADSRIAKLGLIANHKSVGMTILMLAVLRLVWRAFNRPPKLPANMPQWQVSTSKAAHWALYALLFAMPITGWLLSSAASYSVSWFNLFTWPDLVAPSETLKERLATTHDWLGKVLFVTAIAHILAACKHHFLDKDDVLKRMSAVIPITLFGLILAGGTLALTNTGETNASAPQPASTEVGPAAPDPNQVEVPASASASVSELPKWQIDYVTSFIEFTAEQAGAPFTGEWQSWEADIRFSNGSPEQSTMDVLISVEGVNTEDADRDSTLLETEFFDVVNHPTVRFKTQSIRSQDEGFTADAMLSIKGESHPIQFDFEVVEDGDSRLLSGTARLDRLSLGVGLGEWADTEWVGQFVDVNVAVVATVE